MAYVATSSAPAGSKRKRCRIIMTICRTRLPLAPALPPSIPWGAPASRPTSRTSLFGSLPTNRPSVRASSSSWTADLPPRRHNRDREDHCRRCLANSEGSALLRRRDEGQEDLPLRGDVEFVVEALSVVLDGAAAEAKPGCDGFGGVALENQFHDLLLAGRQQTGERCRQGGLAGCGGGHAHIFHRVDHPAGGKPESRGQRRAMQDQ